MTPSALYFALYYFHVIGPYFGAAVLADKNIPEFPCFSFLKFNHVIQSFFIL